MCCGARNIKPHVNIKVRESRAPVLPDPDGLNPGECDATKQVPSELSNAGAARQPHANATVRLPSCGGPGERFAGLSDVCSAELSPTPDHKDHGELRHHVDSLVVLAQRRHQSPHRSFGMGQDLVRDVAAPYKPEAATLVPSWDVDVDEAESQRPTLECVRLDVFEAELQLATLECVRPPVVEAESQATLECLHDSADALPPAFYRTLGTQAMKDQQVGYLFRSLEKKAASDPHLQRKLDSGELQLCNGPSLPSRFLKLCMSDRWYAAGLLWWELDVADQLDFRRAYLTGPPTPEFYLNIVMPHNLEWEVGPSGELTFTKL